MVGLTNVDDTTDDNKPVSAATSSALALKANLASPTFTGRTTLADVSMNGNVDISGTLTVTNQNNNTVINTTVNEYTSIVTEDISLNGKLSVSGDVSFNSSGRVDVCGNFYAQYPDDSIPSSAIIGGVGSGSGSSSSSGGSVVNANGQTFFDIITQQPGKFTYDNSSNTTASLTIDWNYDDIKGKITDTAHQAFLNFQSTTATKNIPYMNELQIDISSSNASEYGWIPYETINVSNADYHEPDYKTLTIKKNTGIGSYENVLSSTYPFDIRVYGKNNAYNYPDENTRALIFNDVFFVVPSAPSDPSFQHVSVVSDSELTITYKFIEPEAGDSNSPAKLNESQVKYKEYETLSSSAYDLSNTIHIDTETDESVTREYNFTTVLENLRAGTKYNFLTRINNDLIDTYSINDTDWDNVGGTVAFDTKGPTPFTSLPGNDNISSSDFTPDLSYNGTTNVTTSEFTDLNIIYINTAADQTVTPTNGDVQTFQISDQSANTDSTSGFGKYIDNVNDLVQVKAYVNNVEKQTLAYQGFQTGSTTSYGTAEITESSSEINYFDTPTQDDIYSDDDARKGYRLKGIFKLLTISNNDVETAVGGASSTPYVLNMEFLRDSTKVGGPATTNITSNIYVDTLSGNPSATSTNTATVESVVWTMGIPSVKKYKIDCAREYSNINSLHGFIRGDRKLSEITAVTASSNSTNSTGFTSGSIYIDSTSISIEGTYTYDATTFKSANSNNLQSLHYTSARYNTNETVDISENMFSLKSNGTQNNNNTFNVSHHFDIGSYTGYGTDLQSKLSLTDVYEIGAFENLGTALGSITVTEYSSHTTIPQTHTLLYYNGLFKTGGYPDVTAYTWDSVTDDTYTYDAGSFGLTTSGSSTASGDKYKWTAFRLNKIGTGAKYSFNGNTYDVKTNGDATSFLSAVDMFVTTGLFDSDTISDLFDVNSTNAIGFCRATKSGTSTNVYGYFKNNFNTTQTWTNAGTNATGYSSLSSAKYGCYVQHVSENGSSDYGIQVSSTAISDDLHVFIGLKIE